MSARDVAFTLMALGHVAGCRGKSDTETLAEAVGEIVRLQSERDSYRRMWAVCGLAAQGVEYVVEDNPNASLNDVLTLAAERDMYRKTLLNVLPKLETQDRNGINWRHDICQINEALTKEG